MSRRFLVHKIYILDLLEVLPPKSEATLIAISNVSGSKAKHDTHAVDIKECEAPESDNTLT